MWPGQNHGGKKNNEANWMVGNSAKLDPRAKQHTEFGVSTSNGSRDMGRTKSWRKKKERKKNELGNPIKRPIRGSLIIIIIMIIILIIIEIMLIIIVITRQVLGRPVCDRGAIPRNFGPIERGEKQTNDID